MNKKGRLTKEAVKKTTIIAEGSELATSDCSAVEKKEKKNIKAQTYTPRRG